MKMKRFSVPVVVSALLLSFTLGNTSNFVKAENSTQGTVTADWLTVRNGPSTNNKAIAWIKKGTKVTILKDYGKFVQVVYNGNSKGYVSDSYLKITKVASTSTATTQKKVSVGSDRLNVRTGPSTSYKIVGKLLDGNIVNVYSQSGKWFLVEYHGLKGYVHGDFLVNVNNGTPSPSQPNTTPSQPADQNADIYVVKSGDSLWKISVATKVSVQDLMTFNNLTTSVIYVGQQLKLKPTNMNTILAGRTVVLDAGHGGKDPGAMANGLREKDINLSVTLKVKTLLEQSGARVVLSRSDDTYIPYDGRYLLASKTKGDIFLSIHSNSSTSPNPYGSETYYSKVPYNHESNPYPNESIKLASLIETNFAMKTNSKNLGVKDAGFIVIRKNTVPAALIELAFISNPTDAGKLASATFQQQAAEGIYQGIVEYFK